MIRRPCPECAGDGRVRTRRTIKVRIPAGVEDGTHIQLAGEGEIGPGGGPPGDLFLEIVAAAARRSSSGTGDDLHCTVTIPMTAAALGATLPVETLDGPEDMDIRPGTQSGQVDPAVRAGRPRTCNESGRGDLVIHVTVETPTKLDAGAGGAAARAGQAARRGGARRASSRPGSRASSPACGTPSTAADGRIAG